MTTFTWPHLPTNESEFEALMRAIDDVLAAEGITPPGRPIRVAGKFWEAFQWSGLMCPPKELADQPGFRGDTLMAKAQRWFERMYADKLKMDWAYGFAPARIGNALWRVRAGVIFGAVQFYIDRNLESTGSTTTSGRNGGVPFFNMLRAVEGLPQGLADRLSDEALKEYAQFHILLHQSLQWRAELPRTELFNVAYNDYDESTASVLGGRFGQARWAAQQAVEKTLKGLLSIGGTAYPTGGARGHSLSHVASLLMQHHGVLLNTSLLAAAECSPAVRYGEVESTESQALLANHAVLGLLDQLRQSQPVAALLATVTTA